MRSFERPFALFSCGLIQLFALGCSGGAPVQPPTTPSPQVTGIQIGVAGNAPASVAPGATLQLWAVATLGSGITSDATNIAEWQSSNSAVATVSGGGVLTALTEGVVAVSASYQKTATLQATVRQPGCESFSVSPPSRTISGLGPQRCTECELDPVLMITTPASCPWTARSDSPWLTFGYRSSYQYSDQYHVSGVGSGTLSYTMGSNALQSERTGHIVVTSGNNDFVHTVTQQQLGCFLAVTPVTASFPSSGGSGSFVVSTTPSDCVWKAEASSYDIRITAGLTGLGTGTVTYVVDRNRLQTARGFTISVSASKVESLGAYQTISLAAP
jgi:hypothetical protein